MILILNGALVLDLGSQILSLASEILEIIRNKFRKNENHRMDSAEQKENAEKRQIVDEILVKMNGKEAAIKQGELEEQELQEAIEQLQKRQRELEMRKMERVDETKKQWEELLLLRRRLHPALSECHRARAKAKPRFAKIPSKFMLQITTGK